MALPINIDTLIHGKVVEWERLEFKEGWNPEKIIHSICAFANDINNWGGGYIIVGIKEKSGQPVLPPKGINPKEIDSIQKEIIKLSHKVLPNYFPIIQPYILHNKHIMVLWCPAGDNRPYTAPSTQGNKSQRYPYVRVGSESIIAKTENLKRLNELSARIPFDDRVNQQATINDLNLGTIRSYLHEVKSDLFEESASMPFEDLCRTMHIAKGSSENILPVNVGLLFFSNNPEKFFSRSWIELVWHIDNSVKNFKEHYFKGPLHKQLRDTLSFIETNIIIEKVIKVPNRAEADRFYNFPYEAVEEALSNAVYHKSYEVGSPIEVQVWPDKIEILSFPGPVPPVNAKILKTQKRIVSREYRNRRIGDFLKELHLTEGRGTGFPTIYNAMIKNSSPSPIFETDDNSTHMLVTIPANTAFSDQVNDQESNRVKPFTINNIEDLQSFANNKSNAVSNAVSNAAKKVLINEVHNRVAEILNILTVKTKRSEMFVNIGLSNQSKNRAKYLDPLINLGWVVKEYPEEENNPNQTYQTTEIGNRILKLLIGDKTV